MKLREDAWYLLVLTYLVYEIKILNNNNDHVKFEQYSKYVKSNTVFFHWHDGKVKSFRRINFMQNEMFLKFYTNIGIIILITMYNYHSI